MTDIFPSIVSEQTRPRKAVSSEGGGGGISVNNRVEEVEVTKQVLCQLPINLKVEETKPVA